jgi:PKD domain
MPKQPLRTLLVFAVLVIAGCGGSGSQHAARDGDREGADHRARIEAGDPDKGHETGGHTPNAAAYQDRAYPKRYLTAAQTRSARKAYRALPTRLPTSAFRPGVRDRAARAAVGASWVSTGPDIGFAPGPTTESLRDSITSGRVTAEAIDPNCGKPGKGCRLWVAAAGGGVWRTSNALASTPQWTAVDSGLPTNNLGSVIVDPTDSTGDTLYAGTGEANAINEAGLGLYRSADGGDHWALVAGSYAVAHDRSIGAIRVDPDNADTIWIGTALGRNGQSSTNGGTAEPPGAPALGVYESTDGGATFTLRFSQPQDVAAGGVTDIELDPQTPSTVYASLLGYGVWRTTGSDWAQVFVPQNPAGDDRVEIALTRRSARTRAYAMDGGSDNNTGAPTGDVFRVDNASVPAAALVGAGNDNAGWTQLSSPTDGDPGYAVHDPCQGQCSYDMFLEVDPSNPDVVWEGGSMVYEEIRPLQDSSLRGVASNRSNGRAVMRSTDAGVSWTDMSADTQTPHYEQMHPDQHALVFDPADPSVAIVGSDGGVVRTDGIFDDASGSCATRDGVAESPTDLADCRAWLSAVPHRIVNMNAGLKTLQFVALAVDPRDPDGDLLGGTQDNGTFAFSGSPRTWFESVNGDGASAGFDAADPNVRVHTFFLGAMDVNHRGSDPLYWTFISQPLLDSGERVSFYTAMTTDPAVSGTIFAGQQHVWRTQDDGGPQASLEKYCAGPGGVPQYDPSTTTCGDFETIGPDLTDPALGSRTDAADYIVDVVRTPADTTTLWVGGRRGRLFVSHDADAPAAKVTFDRIDKGASPGRFPSGIAIDPADPNHVWVSYSGYGANTPSTPGHVYDVHYDPASGGASFQDISYDLADQPITAIAHDDYTGDLYGGTDNGVVRLPAGATHWEQAAPGLPAVTTPGLTLAGRGRVLYAATYGRSTYKLSLAPGARIASPSTVAESDTIVFDGSDSAAAGDAALTYHWSFPDGATADGRTVAWKAAGTGARTVTLTVTAPDGRSGIASKTLTVTAAPPGGGGSGSGGGGSGSGGGGSGGATKPSGAVTLSARSFRLTGRTLRVRLVCPRTQTNGCAGRATITVKVGSRSLRLGSAPFAIPAGKVERVSVRVPKATRKHLGRRHSLKAIVTIKLLKAGGGAITTRLAFTLKR